MAFVKSNDGTKISYEKLGQNEGMPVIIVGAALQDSTTYHSLAEHLSESYTVINYDRRGRGESEDTLPYSVDREIEDLDALITYAGGRALVYGHSSGAALTLHAVISGLPIFGTVLHEPPFVGKDDDERSLAARKDAETINALLEQKRRSEALSYMLRSLGVPPELVSELSLNERMLKMVDTLTYDFEALDSISREAVLPANLVSNLHVPALVLCGGSSPEWMIDVGKQLADSLPKGQHSILGGEEHYVAADVLAPVLAKFFSELNSTEQS